MAQGRGAPLWDVNLLGKVALVSDAELSVDILMLGCQLLISFSITRLETFTPPLIELTATIEDSSTFSLALEVFWAVSQARFSSIINIFPLWPTPSFPPAFPMYNKNKLQASGLLGGLVPGSASATSSNQFSSVLDGMSSLVRGPGFLFV